VALAEIDWTAKVNHNVAFFCFLQMTSKANMTVKCQCPVYPRPMYWLQATGPMMTYVKLARRRVST
jgi:hypothetical protein